MDANPYQSLGASDGLLTADLSRSERHKSVICGAAFGLLIPALSFALAVIAYLLMDGFCCS